MSVCKFWKVCSRNCNFCDEYEAEKYAGEADDVANSLFGDLSDKVEDAKGSDCGSCDSHPLLGRRQRRRCVVNSSFQDKTWWFYANTVWAVHLHRVSFVDVLRSAACGLVFASRSSLMYNSTVSLKIFELQT